jgi:thiamine-phosphate diphosphorylase
VTRAPLPRLHLVTDDEVLGGERFPEIARSLLVAGGGAVALHLRGRRTGGARLWAHAERLARIVGETGGTLLVNDRIDVALACGCGVQVGATSFPVAAARQLLGPDRLLGASVHGLDEAAAAVDAGADFLLAGTLFETASHPGRPGAGVVWLGPVIGLGVPVVGIGGIAPERAAIVRGCGAWGVGVIRGVWNAPDPIATMEEYLERLA